MKKISLSSLVITLISFSVILFITTGCKTSKANVSGSMSKNQLLIEKTWQVDKLYHVISGQYSSYTRGGPNTTGINYDLLRFTFNADGTGKHIGPDNKTYYFSWKLNPGDSRSLLLTNNGRTDSWDMLEIAGDYLHAAANLNINGDTNNLEVFRLIQVK
ncbi:MAG: hypothetical protein QM791_17895 [Ferruginibacter sp.]